jgi:hypothetical protein
VGICIPRLSPTFFKSTYIGFGIEDGEYHGVQITVFTFWHPVGKRVLKNALLETDIETLVRTKKEGYEGRECLSHEAEGLGFYFANPLVDDYEMFPEPVRFSLKSPHLGLGQSDWMQHIRSFIKAKVKKFTRRLWSVRY